MQLANAKILGKNMVHKIQLLRWIVTEKHRYEESTLEKQADYNSIYNQSGANQSRNPSNLNYF